MLQLKRAPAPKPPQPQTLAAVEGFQLRLLDHEFAGKGTAGYELAVNDAPNGGVDISVSVDAMALTACELELDYPRTFTPGGGQPQSWPEDGGQLVYNVDMNDPGRLVYSARLRDEAAQQGASGRFEIVRLVFAEAQAPVAQPLPQDGAAQQWLQNCYFTLPALAGTYSVYGNADWQQAADDIYRLANEARAKKGQPALLRDPHLDAVAQAHALDMASAKYFEHKNLNGMEVFERLNAAGAPRWWSAGENIAAGQRTPLEAHTSWMNSSGHKVNIRGESFQRIGVGVYYDASSPYGWYWVQVFAGFDEAGTGTSWLEPGRV